MCLPQEVLNIIADQLPPEEISVAYNKLISVLLGVDCRVTKMNILGGKMDVTLSMCVDALSERAKQPHVKIGEQCGH